MLRVLTLELHKAISQIDSMMAQAIQGLVEKGLGDFEPINPIQAAIANMLTQNLQICVRCNGFCDRWKSLEMLQVNFHDEKLS